MRYVFSSLGSLVFLMWSTQAQAIGNLSPASMGDWNGKTYDRANSIQQGYDIVVRQLGMAIANHPHAITSVGIHAGRDPLVGHQEHQVADSNGGRYVIRIAIDFVFESGLFTGADRHHKISATPGAAAAQNQTIGNDR